MKSQPKKKIIKKYNRIKLLTIYKKTYIELTTFWRPITLVVLIFAALYSLLIIGLNFLPSLQDLQDQVSNYVGESAGNLVRAFTLVAISVTNNTQSDATSLLQFLVFIIASLALVFTLRKVQQLKKVKITEAYYQGNSNLIPVTLVTIMLIICLVPVGLGGVVLSTGLQYYASGIELFAVSAISGMLLLVSAYLLAIWWPAFYIASLPGTKPLAAMRAARNITKYQRFKILGIFSLTIVILFIIFFTILIPLAIVLPIIVPASAYILFFIYFAIIHAMLFTIYRSLIDEPRK